jgi:hypothetical protein
MLLAGIAVWIARLASRDLWRPTLWLVIPWGILVLGVATTMPVQSQRMVALSPFWALAAGTGIVAIVRWLTAREARPHPILRPALVIAIIGALGLSQFAWYMDDARQRTTFGADHRTLIAWDLGWRLSDDDPESPGTTSILFAGPPYMFIGNWGNMRYQAPETNRADIEMEIIGPENAPALPAGTLLVLVPERSGERCAIARAYPDALSVESRARDGSLLYTAFYRGELANWTTGVSPAGTTFDPVTIDGCPP